MMNEKWTVEKAWSWYNARFPIMGCNYLPKTAVNSTEMWQRRSFDVKTIASELRLAARSGMNSVRVFLPYIVWEDGPAAFRATLYEFLGIAGEYGISIMPVLFDDCAFSGKEPYLGE